MLTRILNYYRRKKWSAEKYARYIGVKIGENCNIQNVSFGSEPYLIEIGNHVQITSGTKFFTHGAAWVLREKNPNIDFFGKIYIGSNVYIGNNAIILAGVTVGSNVIISAGAVVTKSVSDGDIVGGNPCRVIGKMSEFEKKMTEFDVKTKGLNYQEKKKELLKLSKEKFIKK